MNSKVGSRVTQMEDAGGFPVAVKRWSKGEPLAEKAQWEQEVLGMIRGPGIPQWVRSFEDADYFYVVTEWISGPTLDKYVAEKGCVLEEKEALYIGRELYRLLLRLHTHEKGCFVYTDLKPSNVILKDRQVFLVDFESVCAAGTLPVQGDSKTVVMGSRPFTAPEVFAGQISPACDYYSLGALLFYMMTGRLWRGEVGDIRENPLGVRLLRLLSPEPGKRKSGLKLFAFDGDVSFQKTELPAPVQSRMATVREEPTEIRLSDSRAVFIDCNPRFAVELAYEASMRMDLKVGLFFTEQACIPVAAGNLGIRKVSIPKNAALDEKQETELLGATAEQWMRRGVLMQPEGFGRLYLGLATPEAIMPHMDNTGWGRFLHWVSGNFDMAILAGNIERDYGAAFCDMVIMATQSNLWEATLNRYRRDWFCANEFAVPVRFVAWEYKEGVSLPSAQYAELVGKTDFLGEIYHDGNRQIAENRGSTPYCFAIPNIIREQYKAVLSGIVDYLEHKYERSSDAI